MLERSNTKSTTKVLVYGWYHQGNIGDDLFMDAFQHLFLGVDFVFTDSITEESLQDIDAIFFGGGSFLFDAPRITQPALALLKQKKIFYIGVGVEVDINPIHLDLMSQAKLIAIRTSNQLDRIKQINSNTRVIPDLIYALPKPLSGSQIDKSVLVLPNIAVLPQYSDPNWKHASWHYFKSEFCPFLDALLEWGYQVNIFPMCIARKEDDTWAANEIVSFMQRRSNGLLLDGSTGRSSIYQLVSQHSIVITQRFHGIVLSELCQVPYISIHHHDKLKPTPNRIGQFISYYGISKDALIQVFDNAYKNSAKVLPIETNIFEVLVQDVLSLL